MIQLKMKNSLHYISKISNINVLWLNHIELKKRNKLNAFSLLVTKKPKMTEKCFGELVPHVVLKRSIL